MASSPVTPASLEGGTPSPTGNEEPATTRQVHVCSVQPLACPITVTLMCEKQHTELHLEICQFNTYSGICKVTCVHERDFRSSLSQQKLLGDSACI